MLNLKATYMPSSEYSFNDQNVEEKKISDAIFSVLFTFA